jgi:hypothetical protein
MLGIKIQIYDKNLFVHMSGTKNYEVSELGREVTTHSENDNNINP